MKSYLKIFLVFSLLLLVEFVNAQSARKNTSWYLPYYVAPNEIRLNIIFEGIIKIQDTELKSYSLSWEDTMGLKQNTPFYNKRYELKVIVRDKDTIVGNYTGLSTPMTHCNFSTNSKDVFVHFWLAKNQFYDRNHRHQADTSANEFTISPSTNKVSIDIISINKIGLIDIFPVWGEYTPIKIDLTKINRNIIDSYDKKKVVLDLNQNIVALDYMNKGALNPDPMPHMGPNYQKVMALNRYQMDRKTGKIKKGKHWISLKGIRKCCEIDFAIIDPHLLYKDKAGNQFSGESLIRKRKLELSQFHYYEFKSIFESLPY